jgi:hypothetical protein
MIKRISSVEEGSNEDNMGHYSKIEQLDTFEIRS